MRIGMMVDVYKPHISGVTNFVTLNKRYLESLGHQVYVFTFAAGDYQDDEENVIRSPGIPLLDTGIQFSLRYTPPARRLLQTMDVAHVHHPFMSGTLSLLYCQPRGIPIVFTNHTRYDLYAQAYLPGITEVVGTAALQAYLPAFCRGCDLVISPSAGMRAVLEQLGVEVPVEVVPNGVDLKPFQDACEPIPRTALGFSDEHVVLLFVGRLGPEKNLAFLLRSFAGAVQASDAVRLALVGDGPERENLVDQVNHSGIADKVHFVGAVDYTDVPRYMAMADALVTASVTEVHPLTVIEGMAAGLPVLGIQSPGVGDTVEEGVTGFLAPQEDMAMFTAKMVRLCLEDEERQQMGDRARHAAEQYNIEKTVTMMVDRYQRVITDSAPRRRGMRVRLDHWLDRFRS